MILSFFALESPFALSSFFFFNDTATTEIYTLSLHDALPIYVGEQRDDQARADCGAVDRRHHRLVEVDHVVDEVRRLAHGACGRVGVPRHLLDEREVATGGEGLTGAGDERHAHLPIGVHGQPHLGELPVQARVRRVHHLRSVDRDQEHPVRLPLEGEVLVVSIVHDRLLSRTKKSRLVTASDAAQTPARTRAWTAPSSPARKGPRNNPPSTHTR